MTCGDRAAAFFFLPCELASCVAAHGCVLAMTAAENAIACSRVRRDPIAAVFQKWSVCVDVYSGDCMPTHA